MAFAPLGLDVRYPASQPFGRGLLSFQGWAPELGLFDGKFVGMANYADLLEDPDFLGSIKLTLFYTFLTVSAELACGLGIALLLNIDLPYIAIFRTFLVVPMMITPVVAAFCWKLLLDPDHGVINYWIGEHIVWLGRPDTARLVSSGGGVDVPDRSANRGARATEGGID